MVAPLLEIAVKLMETTGVPKELLTSLMMSASNHPLNAVMPQTNGAQMTMLAI
jgi:hypothetical protein